MRLKDKIVRRMIELAGDEASEWTAIGTGVGATIRWTKTQETPAYAREKRPGQAWAMWEGETYDSHVFITLVAGKFILGVAGAPWVGRQDSDAPLWLVEAILEDPELAHDDTRRWAMRDARKAARS